MTIAEKKTYIREHINDLDESAVEQFYELLRANDALREKLVSRAIKSEENISNGLVYSRADIEKRLKYWGMKVVFTDQSIDSLNECMDFLSLTVNPRKIKAIQNSILDKAETLAQNPGIGQAEPLLQHLGFGHRRIVFHHIKIIYKIEGDSVIITDFFDSRQDPCKMKGWGFVYGLSLKKKQKKAPATDALSFDHYSGATRSRTRSLASFSYFILNLSLPTVSPHWQPMDFNS